VRHNAPGAAEQPDNIASAAAPRGACPGQCGWGLDTRGHYQRLYPGLSSTVSI